MFRDTITTIDELRAVIPNPGEPAVRKQIDIIDEHCREFIKHATFMLLATSSREGRCDVSPKGDVAGFAQVLDEHTLLIPDRPGNQRADSLLNIIDNPHVGLLFIIPGVEWTLRVNGGATIVRDAEMLARCAVEGKQPALAIAVDVEEVFLHCPKCFMRSQVWDTSTWLPPDDQPSFARMARDHAKYESIPLDVVEKALEASNKQLY
jgi:PPOX class probable FMN-dependent enzyme